MLQWKKKFCGPQESHIQLHSEEEKLRKLFAAQASLFEENTRIEKT